MKATKLAATSALAVLLTTSAFAADHRGDVPPQQHSAQQSQRAVPQSRRVDVSGRVTSLSRERDGYRVQLDRGRDSYWIPSSRIGAHARDLRVGVSIQIGGVFNRGVFNVDAVNWPGYDQQGYLRGVVERLDNRRDMAMVRDSETGRRVEVDTRSLRRNDLRRGDRVTLEGQWERGDVFQAYRIDRVR